MNRKLSSLSDSFQIVVLKKIETLWILLKHFESDIFFIDHFFEDDTEKKYFCCKATSYHSIIRLQQHTLNLIILKSSVLMHEFEWMILESRKTNRNQFLESLKILRFDWEKKKDMKKCKLQKYVSPILSVWIIAKISLEIYIHIYIYIYIFISIHYL